MEFIKSWTVCVCITLIISVIFITLSPKGSMGKFYKIIISIFIFISFLYPLTSFNSNEFKINFELENDFSAAMENSVNKQIEDSVKLLLENNNIKSSVVKAETSVLENEAVINKVTVSIIDDYDAEEVEKIIFDNLGIIAEVKRIGE